MGLCLAQEPEADAFITKNPIALLVGMVLDQQVRLEGAFAAPLELQRRLGFPLTAASIASCDRDTLIEAFTAYQPLHRYPVSMGDRVQRLCVMVVEEYDGDPERIWKTAKDGGELVSRMEAMPGFGKPKARIFTALLGKQLGCQPTGWREASKPYGDDGTRMSVADITDKETLGEVRTFKAKEKARAKAAAEAKKRAATA
jgi:uncharacterized HhH-GPD family protein